MLDRLLLRARPFPPEPPRRRGATSLEPEHDGFAVFRAILASIPWLQIGLGGVIVFLAALVPWGTGKILEAMDQQILAIDVKGDFVGDSRVAIERDVSRWLGQSYFATDLADIKAELERRPWVASAAIRRVWPDRLVIDIREKKPLAYWNEGSLVSRSGEVFTPPNPEVAGQLPRLSGPDERVRDVIRMARELSSRLSSHGLGFAGLRLEPRGAWTLDLANGIEVVLGRNQVNERFERFLAVYEARLVSRSDEVKRVDARYTNGVAVQWKSGPDASGPNS